MIKFTTDKNQIISLWQRVFGDDEDYINYFLDKCVNKSCLGYFENDKLVSMLFLIDCTYCGCKGKYVYAVATDEKCRGRGYASSLINEAKTQMSDFLWLIPATESLFEYYSRLGFETRLYTDSRFENSIIFNESEEVIAELYDGSEFEYPKGMLYSVKNFPDGNTGIKVNKGE